MIRGIGLRGAVAVNVITMIGIGPLITIPLVLATLHGSTALVAWVVGAIIALCDGLAWAELGSLYPGSGGTYVFLREAFGRETWGRMLAFLFAWQIVLSAPLVLASGYIGFAHYAAYLWPALASDTQLQGIVAAALAVVTLVILYRPIRTVNAIGIALAGIAVATLAAVIASAATHFSRVQAFSAEAHPGFFAALAAGLGPALVITLYDYYGYGQSCTLGDEVRDTKIVLPRSVIISIALVAVLYIALQIGVLGIVSWHELVPATDGGTIPDAANYVASLVVERTLGSWPARIVTVAILITAFASTFGNLLGYSRIPFSAARDGVFLKPFASLDARGHFPNVSLVAIGLLAIPACFLSLGDVINALTTGLVIIQSLAQLGAIVALRARKIRAPYRMVLFPLPLVVAALGWTYIFFSSGSKAIAFGIVSLLAGAAIYIVRSKISRDWPFKTVPAALAAVAMLSAGAVARPALAAAAAPVWGHATNDIRAGNPVFAVDGKPFFVYGAAFFYERIPRARWSASMDALRRLGINTLDLYVPWNWHELADGDFDFTGRTNPRRDLDRVLLLAREHGFKILLRPGPVIRNEWRNGGYPAWLLSRPEYGMPLHDLLEGRYPPTATLQNQHSDQAAAEWMNNATHMTYAKRWIERVLHEVSPYADLILAVALDDDQGAYIDNQTYHAPHFDAYIGDLASWVHGVTGSSELVYINTYQMKVTAKAPAWAMGNWYQSDAYSIGEHDRSQLEFSTSLLHTQPGLPMMTSEFQAGWLQQPGDTAPRPADPSNTLLALATMIGQGVRGVVNFPAQDTLDPAGWEAPFANAMYAWDAALDLDANPAPRYAPTANIGGLVRLFGPELAAAVPENDGAIAYLGESYLAHEDNAFFAQVADRTIIAQRACRDAALSCALIDPEAIDARTVQKYPFLIVPEPDVEPGAPLREFTRDLFDAYRKAGGILIRKADPGSAELFDALRARGRKPIVANVPGAAFARDVTGKLAGFLTVTNYGDTDENVAGASIDDGAGVRVALPPFHVTKHAALVVPLDVHLKAFDDGFATTDRLIFTDCMPTDRSSIDASHDAGTLDAKAAFGYRPSQRTPCTMYVRTRGSSYQLTPADSRGVIYGNGRIGRPLAEAEPATPIVSTGAPPLKPRAGSAIAYANDLFADGAPCIVFDNALVRLVVSPEAGARAFVFADETGRNAFTTTGAMRDDVAVEPPLSTTDRIAKYTHQFPAGMFDRPYAASIEETGPRAVARFSYDAPDIVPNGAALERTITLEPGARAFDVDESADFHQIAAADPQRIVSVTSIGGQSGTVLSPASTPFAPQTTIHASGGHALGFYSNGSLTTIAWRAGDVEDAAIEERADSVIVRLTFARDRITHVRYGLESNVSNEQTQTLLAAADAAAQRTADSEKGTTGTPRTL